MRRFLKFQRRERHCLREMPFLTEPETEGIERLDVGVAGDGLDATLPKGTDERLQRGFRERRVCAERSCSALNAVSYHSMVLGVTFFK